MKVEELKETLIEKFSSLSETERSAVILGFPLILALIYLTVVYLPVSNLKGNYERRLKNLESKYAALKPKAEEIYCLKRKLEPAKAKLRKGANLDVSSFVRTAAKTVGLNVARVKTLTGESFGSVQEVTVSVKFGQAELNKVLQFINYLEKSPYYFKSDGISVSDFDGDGLVSGRVTFLFFRRSE